MESRKPFNILSYFYAQLEKISQDKLDFLLDLSLGKKTTDGRLFCNLKYADETLSAIVEFQKDTINCYIEFALPLVEFGCIKTHVLLQKNDNYFKALNEEIVRITPALETMISNSIEEDYDILWSIFQSRLNKTNEENKSVLKKYIKNAILVRIKEVVIDSIIEAINNEINKIIERQKILFPEEDEKNLKNIEDIKSKNIKEEKSKSIEEEKLKNVEQKPTSPGFPRKSIKKSSTAMLTRMSSSLDMSPRKKEILKSVTSSVSDNLSESNAGNDKHSASTCTNTDASISTNTHKSNSIKINLSELFSSSAPKIYTSKSSPSSPKTPDASTSPFSPRSAPVSPKSKSSSKSSTSSSKVSKPTSSSIFTDNISAKNNEDYIMGNSSHSRENKLSINKEYKYFTIHSKPINHRFLESISHKLEEIYHKCIDTFNKENTGTNKHYSLSVITNTNERINVEMIVIYPRSGFSKVYLLDQHPENEVGRGGEGVLRPIYEFPDTIPDKAKNKNETKDTWLLKYLFSNVYVAKIMNEWMRPNYMSNIREILTRLDRYYGDCVLHKKHSLIIKKYYKDTVNLGDLIYHYGKTTNGIKNIVGKHYLKPEIKLDYFIQIIEEVLKYHSKELAHKDIKPENFIVSKLLNGERKIILIDEETTSMTGNGFNLVLMQIDSFNLINWKKITEKQKPILIKSNKEGVCKFWWHNKCGHFTDMPKDFIFPEEWKGKSEVFVSCDENISKILSKWYLVENKFHVPDKVYSGTPGYNPPEIECELNVRLPYSKKTDLYSTGITLAVLLSGLCYRKELDERLKKVKNDERKFFTAEDMALILNDIFIKPCLLIEKFKSNNMDDSWVNLPQENLFEYSRPQLGEIIKDDIDILKMNLSDIFDEITFQIKILPQLISIISALTMINPSDRLDDLALTKIIKELSILPAELKMQSQKFKSMRSEDKVILDVYHNDILENKIRLG